MNETQTQTMKIGGKINYFVEKYGKGGKCCKKENGGEVKEDKCGGKVKKKKCCGGCKTIKAQDGIKLIYDIMGKIKHNPFRYYRGDSQFKQILPEDANGPVKLEQITEFTSPVFPNVKRIISGQDTTFIDKKGRELTGKKENKVKERTDASERMY